MDALRVPAEEAVAIQGALSGIEVYLSLAGRGWTSEQWERFVIGALTSALLQAGETARQPAAFALLCR